MSEQTHAADSLTLGTETNQVRLDRLLPVATLFGVLLTLGFGGYLLSQPKDLQPAIAGSWLFGWGFWLTVTLGMFALQLLHHTVRGRWTVPLLRIFEAGGGHVSLLVMALLFVPFLLAPGTVYEWAHLDIVEKDSILRWKAPYLNHAFWAFRFFFFFGSWIWLAWFLSNSARKQEVDGNFHREMGRSSWGAPSMVWFALSLTFAMTDWFMSLEPHWYSTMYGVWTLIGSALSALAFGTVVLCVNAKKDPYNTIVQPNLTKDIGNMLFAITMLWAYTSVSQFLIIWNGNIPETTQYYIRRSQNWWNGVGMATIVGQFLVPWMTLLSPRVKRYPHLLQKIAGWIFFVHIIDVYQLIVPALPGGHHGEGEHGRAFGEFFLFDAVAFLAVGSIWLAIFAARIKTAPLLPTYDNRLQEEFKHGH